jgi:hypothetical protein
MELFQDSRTMSSYNTGQEIPYLEATKSKLASVLSKIWKILSWRFLSSSRERLVPDNQKQDINTAVIMWLVHDQKISKTDVISFKNDEREIVSF